jgi:hypothetical protein
MGHGTPALAVGMPRNSLPPNVTKTRWGHLMDRLIFVRARAPQLHSPALGLSMRIRSSLVAEESSSDSASSTSRWILSRILPPGPSRDHARIPKISSASSEIDALVHLAKADILIQQGDPIGSRDRARVSSPRCSQDIIEEKRGALHLEGSRDHSWCYSSELKKYPCPNPVFMIH